MFTVLYISKNHFTHYYFQKKEERNKTKRKKVHNNTEQFFYNSFFSFIPSKELHELFNNNKLVTALSQEQSSDDGLPGGSMNGGLCGGSACILLDIGPGPWGYISKSLKPSVPDFSPDLPSCFNIIRRHLARAFWNQTWKEKHKIRVLLETKKNDAI